MPSDAVRGPVVACIAWTAQTARADELALALEGISLRVHHVTRGGKAAVPLRYARNAITTVRWLQRNRPTTVIVQNPPVFAGVVAYVWARRARASLILDSHPASFGRKDRLVWKLLLPLSRWLARRANAVLVTVQQLGDEVRSWGATPLIVHEAPPGLELAVSPKHPDTEPRTVLFVGVFASDEPVAAVISAARMLPGLRFEVTGDIAKSPPGLADSAPENVAFLGYLGPEDYRAALEKADVILALTTEETSVVRAGYEAVYACRPLIVSDTPDLRTVFAHAVHVRNDASDIARGVRDAIADYRRLLDAAGPALAMQESRWAEQLSALARIVHQSG